MRIWITCLLALCLATSAAAETVEIVAKNGVKIDKTSSRYDVFRRFSPPTIKQSDGTVDYEEYHLDMLLDRKGRPTFFLYVRIIYAGDWRFYEGARLPGPVQLHHGTVDRRVNVCRTGATICVLEEELAILIPAWAVASAAQGKSLTVRISSQRGPDVFVDLEPHHAVALRQFIGSVN